jgi:hypothetical protein
VDWFTLSRIGLIFNFVGTVMIALSFGRNLGEAYQTDQKGRRIYLASFLSPLLFKVGLVLAALGFLLQLLA